MGYETRQMVLTGTTGQVFMWCDLCDDYQETRENESQVRCKRCGSFLGRKIRVRDKHDRTDVIPVKRGKGAG